MNVLYEKLEDFLDMLKTTPKDIPVYMTIVRNTRQDGLVSAEITAQILEHNVARTYRYSDGLPSFQMVNDSWFNCILDDKVRASSRMSYEAGAKHFNEVILSEYDKFVEAIKDAGFKQIVNAYIE